MIPVARYFIDEFSMDLIMSTPPPILKTSCVLFYSSVIVQVQNPYKKLSWFLLSSSQWRVKRNEKRNGKGRTVGKKYARESKRSKNRREEARRRARKTASEVYCLGGSKNWQKINISNNAWLYPASLVLWQGRVSQRGGDPSQCRLNLRDWGRRAKERPALRLPHLPVTPQSPSSL